MSQVCLLTLFIARSERMWLPHMRIEQVTETMQVELIANLASTIWTEYFTPIIGKPQVDYMLEKFQSKNAINEQLNNGFKYYLIYSDSVAVGYMAVVEKENSLFLSKLYIIQSNRGKGYARNAIEFLQKQALNKSIKMISLTVNKYNLAAIETYKKLGFDIKDSIVQDIEHGFVMDDYVMKKNLA